MRRVIVTAAMVEDCLAEMSEEGQAGIEALVETVMLNFHHIPNHKQLGPAMALELIAAVLAFLARPHWQRYERSDW